MLVTGDGGPARGERGNRAAEETVAAVAGSEFALTAHAEFAEVAANVKQSFTVEKAAFSGELTVIGVEAVFERETDLEAVAEVFFTLHAEAAGGVLAGAHVELITVFAIALVRGGVAEARVDAVSYTHLSSAREAQGTSTGTPRSSAAPCRPRASPASTPSSRAFRRSTATASTSSASTARSTAPSCA